VRSGRGVPGFVHPPALRRRPSDGSDG
jgi:hypothetical protein